MRGALAGLGSCKTPRFSLVMSHSYQHLFGPVPSRRFGRSLGVDLVPFKTCTFDCLFCEVGCTTKLTLEPGEYVPTDEILAELETWFAVDGQADVVTLAGSGEPTLHSRFGEIIEAVHRLSGLPVVLLSNSSLLHREDVREQAARADIVKVSLSAWDAASFAAVNQPDSGLTFDALLRGLQLFRDEFSGQLRLEVMLLSGVNATREQVAHVARLALSFRPDVVELNTVVRPPAYSSADAVPSSELESLADLFEPRALVIAPFSKVTDQDTVSSRDAVLAMLSRRPCTLDDVSSSLLISTAQAMEWILELMAAEEIVEKEEGGRAFYMRKG